MSPEQILAKAYRRAQFARHTPRNIPIRDLNKRVKIRVVVLPSDPKPFVPEIPPHAKHPPMKTIIETVANHYGISVMNLVSARRTKNYTLPRHVAMYLCKELTPHSFPTIGRFIGDRDHTTALHGCRKIEGLIQDDVVFGTSIDAIKQKLLTAQRIS